MFWYLSVFSVGTHRGNLLVNRGSIFLRPQYPTVWALCGKTGHAQSINAQACLRSSAVIMSTLNLQIDLLWASSRQHECGIKENKLSESILLSVMLGWVTIHLYVRVYLCRIYIDIYLYTRICVYEFEKTNVVFRTYRFKTATNWWYMPVLTRSFVQSNKWGVHCWFCVCSFAASSFIRKYFSQHISIKSTQTWYMYSFMAQAGYS